jgi:hypothetical protein
MRDHLAYLPAQDKEEVDVGASNRPELTELHVHQGSTIRERSIRGLQHPHHF